MASTDNAQGLSAWKAIGKTSVESGDAVVENAPPGLDAVGIQLSDGSVLTGAESPDGTYTFTRTASSAVLYFIL